MLIVVNLTHIALLAIDSWSTIWKYDEFPIVLKFLHLSAELGPTDAGRVNLVSSDSRLVFRVRFHC
jgi:hypothetical protein